MKTINKEDISQANAISQFNYDLLDKVINYKINKENLIKILQGPEDVLIGYTNRIEYKPFCDLAKYAWSVVLVDAYSVLVPNMVDEVLKRLKGRDNFLNVLDEFVAYTINLLGFVINEYSNLIIDKYNNNELPKLFYNTIMSELPDMEQLKKWEKHFIAERENIAQQKLTI